MEDAGSSGRKSGIITRRDRNCLRGLPDIIGKVLNFNQISINENHLEGFPKTPGNLIYLTRLSAEDNFITELPELIGYIGSLARREERCRVTCRAKPGGGSGVILNRLRKSLMK